MFHNRFISCLLGWLLLSGTAHAGSYALLVAVDKYPAKAELPPLNYPVSDVKQIGSFLERCNFDVTYLTSDSTAEIPTNAAIIEKLQAIARRAANKTDVVLVVLAGHGKQVQRQTSNNAERQIESTSAYCPFDFIHDTDQNALAYEDLVAILEQCHAETKVLIAEACRSGAGKLSQQYKAMASDPSFQFSPPKRPSKTVHLLFSCGNEEKSWEHDKLEHGVFSYFLLKAFKSKSNEPLDLEQLFPFIRNEVSIYVQKHCDGQSQHPQLLKSELYQEQRRFSSVNDKIIILTPPPKGNAGISHGAEMERDNAFKVFRNQTFTGTFRSTIFDRAKFYDCVFDRCIFINVQLNSTRFFDCEFRQCNFQDSETKRMRLIGPATIVTSIPWESGDEPRELPLEMRPN